MRLKSLVLGVTFAVVARGFIIRLLLLKFGRDVNKLNAGDHSSLLAAYDDDFVLHFHAGDHRWDGDWVGKAGMDRFLQKGPASGSSPDSFQGAALSPTGNPAAGCRSGGSSTHSRTLWSGARAQRHGSAFGGAAAGDLRNRSVLAGRVSWQTGLALIAWPL